MNDITQVLVQMKKGKALQAINDKFQKLIIDVTENGGSGEMTLKLKVKAVAHDPGGRLTEIAVSHDVQTKSPKKDLGPSTFFLTRENILTRNNPEQAELFEQEMHETVKEKK